MSSNRDVSRAVRSWLDEGVTVLPDRVLDAVLDQVPTTPQRRAGWLARRFPIMNSNRFRYGIAAAAILIAAFFGMRFLPSNSNIGGPQSTATPTPTATPSPTPTVPRLGDGPLAAGRYMWDPDLGMTVDVPSGWEGWGAAGVLNGEDGPTFAALVVWDVTEIIVYEDPCDWAESARSEPRGMEDIAAALAAQQGRQASEVTDVTIGGVDGKHVRLTVPTDLATELQEDADHTFLDCDLGEYRSWDTRGGDTRYHQGPGQIDELYIIDLADRTLVFDMAYFEATSETDRLQQVEMLDSIRFE